MVEQMHASGDRRVAMAPLPARAIRDLGGFLKTSWMGDMAHHLVMKSRIAVAKRRGMRAHIARQFADTFGYAPNLDRPTTFNEKTQALKFHVQSGAYRQCADKIAVRDFVSQRLGPSILVPLHHCFADASAIRPNRIAPAQFVAKATHDSGSAQLCADRARFNWRSARRRLRYALSRNYAYLHYEIQYKDIPRKIIIEELLPGALRCDYKVFCFGGEPYMTGVNYDRRGYHRHNFFDLDWNKLPVSYARPGIGHPIPAPETYDQMLHHARVLSHGFPFCRVDFFESEGQLYFNELTFHHYSGLMRFDPADFDRELGERLDLSGLT